MNAVRCRLVLSRVQSSMLLSFVHVGSAIFFIFEIASNGMGIKIIVYICFCSMMTFILLMAWSIGWESLRLEFDKLLNHFF